MGGKRQDGRHDPLYKDFFSHQAMVASLLRTFVTEPFEPRAGELDLDSLEPLPGELVTEDHRLGLCDSVWRARWGKKEWWCYVVLLLEFQSRSDHLMPLRLLSYLSHLLLRLEREREEERKRENGRLRQAGKPVRRPRREPLPLVLPVVLYNGASPWRAPMDTAGLFFAAGGNFARFIPKMEYIVIDERRLALERPEFAESLTAQWMRFNRAENPEEKAAALGALARILGEARYEGLDELKRTFALMFAADFRRDNTAGPWQELLDDNNFEEASMLYAEGVRKWENKVRTEERAQMLFSLVHDGLLSPGVAAARANMSEDEFRARMERDRRDRAKGGQAAPGE